VIEIPGYRLLRQLGRGGMATVYLAVQQSVDREVALKVMSPALLVDPDFGERFLREARIAAHLHHRHVVGIYDVGRAGNYHYIAMEYLSGGPVLARDGNARDAAFALRITREIAGALNYAQEKGFVHRDVKPDNILLRDDGSSALTDFGIARALDTTLRMTRTGAVVGTPHYMSPEQARGRQVDGRADLYSLGIVLYEMLIGHVPYRAEDSLAIGIKHITEPVPVLPEALAYLQPLLERLLAKQPEDRFQTGNEVVAAIERVERCMPEGARPAAGAGHPPLTPPVVDVLASAPISVGNVRERAEPDLGHLDQIAVAIDADERTGHRLAAAARRRHGNGPPWGALALFILIGASSFAAWHYQDTLRRLLPRTEFNDTLSRAQRALDNGDLSGQQGRSARELFLAARAQDPDNDTARRGVEQVGRKLLERAQAAFDRGDFAAARTQLDDARELLGGGSDVDRLDQTLKAREAASAQIGQWLDQASKALDAGQIMGADGAAVLYQRVLQNDKGNALAQAGLSKCADALAAQARGALAVKDAAGASTRVDDIVRIQPAYPGLPELQGEIAQVRSADHAVLDETLKRADAQVREGHLDDGEASALVLYRAVLKRDPDNTHAKDGLRRIAQAFVTQADTAIEGGNPDVAEKLINAAAGLAPDSPDVRTARANLRELRERPDGGGTQQPAITPTQADQIRALVLGAAKAAEIGNLILPPGDSAYDKYRAALAIDGNDKRALEGLARLPARAKELFEQALTNGAPLRARAMLDSVNQIAPEDSAIPAMRGRLASAFLDQADLRISEGRHFDATRALNAARELNPNDPRIAALDARLQAMAEGRG
jgi:hypothetical protein